VSWRESVRRFFKWPARIPDHPLTEEERLAEPRATRADELAQAEGRYLGGGSPDEPPSELED
jgi:hypothetical protein